MALTIDQKYTNLFIDDKKLSAYIDKAKTSLQSIYNKDGKGNDFLGWIDLPSSTSPELIDQIENDVKLLSSKVDIVVVIGIGGSYLGAKAVISSLKSPYKDNGPVEVVFAGTDLSGTSLKDLIHHIGDRPFGINMISKSGTTTEPAIAFRILREILSGKVGKKNLSQYIIATTDQSKGALRTYANAMELSTYVIPDDVGGRFSVFTPVGLLPISLAGIDIRQLLKGAKDAQSDLAAIEDDNIAVVYSAIRNYLYDEGKLIEILGNYEPRLAYIAAWWKQLYGESEGKEGLGIYPASVDFTCDLHSMGQYIQDGPRHIFETILKIKTPPQDLIIPSDDNDLDKLNYIKGKSLNYVNDMAMQGTLEAHTEGGVPNIVIEMDKLDAYHIGYLLYFFELACGTSAYMLGVNPFDQPGVEAYKKAMFRLLGKP